MSYPGFENQWYGPPHDGYAPHKSAYPDYSDYSDYDSSFPPSAFLGDDYPNSVSEVERLLGDLSDLYNGAPSTVDATAAHLIAAIRFRLDRLPDEEPELLHALRIWELNLSLNTTLPWHLKKSREQVERALGLSGQSQGSLFYTKAEEPSWRGVAILRDGTLEHEQVCVDDRGICIGSEVYQSVEELYASDIIPAEAIVPVSNPILMALTLAASATRVDVDQIQVEHHNGQWRLGLKSDPDADPVVWCSLAITGTGVTAQWTDQIGPTRFANGNSLTELCATLWPGRSIAGINSASLSRALVIHEMALPSIRFYQTPYWVYSSANLPLLEREIIVFPGGETIETVRDIAEGSFKIVSSAVTDTGYLMTVSRPKEGCSHLVEPKRLERRWELTQALEGVEGVLLGYPIVWQDESENVHLRIVAPLADGNLEELWVLLSEEQRRTLLLQVLTIVNDIHKRNVIHRDLSLSNFLLFDLFSGKPPRVELCDWDTGVVLNRESEWSSTIGTFAYMAPEIAASTTESIDEIPLMKKAEIFSLGMVLLAIYTGHIAKVRGNSSSAPDVSVRERRAFATYETLEHQEVREGGQGFPTKEDASGDPILDLIRRMCNPTNPYERPSAKEALSTLRDTP